MKKTIYANIKTPIVLVCIIIANSCGPASYQTNNNWNIASIYNPLKSELHPVYKVYHNAGNTSILFFKIRFSELYFRHNPVSGNNECSFTLKYKLQQVDNKARTIVDSNSYVYELKEPGSEKFYITQIPINAKEGNSYRIRITLRDNNRKAFSINYLSIEKNRNIAEQYFNITTLNGTPLFRNVLINNGVFRVNHASPNSDKLYISYYKNENEAPKPIVTSISDETKYKIRDSLYITDYEPNSALSLNQEGLYYIQFDTNSDEGVSVLKLNSDYPKVQQPNGLIPPLCYITTDAEYNKLIKQNSPKLAADKFWISIGGSTERGRELIRLYYNRVYFSNYYFTNTEPGWKTERGMVYIVYGPPHKIKKTAFQETWIYEKLGDDGATVKFNFRYSPNKFNLNNYILQRSNSHEWRWTEAVYAWTSGDIFLYD